MFSNRVFLGLWEFDNIEFILFYDQAGGLVVVRNERLASGVTDF